MAPAGPVDVMLVCSSGGHLVQLVALRQAWEGRSRVWVSNDRSDARSILRGEHAYFLPGPVSRSPRSLAGNLIAAVKLIRRHRPAVLLTTGADVAVPFAWIARLAGAKVVYIESFTRIATPSLSLRMINPVSDRVYTQWPELAAIVRHSRYAGAVIERS
jgi:beta-1,4-N-acetylglucosaminyltransferase